MKRHRIISQLMAFSLMVYFLMPGCCDAETFVRVHGCVRDYISGEVLPETLIEFTSLENVSGVVTDSRGMYEISLAKGTVGVGKSDEPEAFTLRQNFPNPFNPATTIEYELLSSAHVRLDIFNSVGQLVRRLVDAEENAGTHTVRWDGCDDSGSSVSAGVYLYQLRSAAAIATKKMTLQDGGGSGSFSRPGHGSVSAATVSKPAYYNYRIVIEKTGYEAYTESWVVLAGEGDDVEKDFYLLPEEAPEAKKLVYEETDELFPNPERGFYNHTVINSLPSLESLTELRDENITLIYTEVNATEFRESDFSGEFLAMVADGLDSVRRAGLKVIFNVVYAHDIGEPDAAKEQVFRHIEQLKPVLLDNWDVIFVAKTGFIGPWGEMHSSTNNLTETGTMRDILFGMLDAFPEERIVMVRTPMQKLAVFENAVLSPEQAHDGSRIARTGFFNDCFLASSSDFGTYESEKTRAQWLDYVGGESMYIVFGGETCSPSDYASCENTIYEMEKLYMTWLNRGWHPDVLKSWTDKGCMPEVKKRLGYRFVLRETEVFKDNHPEGIFGVSFTLDNTGFAAPVNPRLVEIVLRNNETGREFSHAVDTDPRFWFPGESVRIDRRIVLPSDMAAGEYTLLLRLPDPCENLYGDPRYCIRLANTGVWEEATGSNVLAADVLITER